MKEIMMEAKRIKIGILTSGGDAPGMNAAIRAVVRAGEYYGAEVYGIQDGYKGMFEGGKYIFRMDRRSVTDIITRGGTILGTARMKDFVKDENRLIGINNLKQLGISYLITIGGDGTYQGAKRLTELGMPCIALPGTIDNDIPSTDFTIGFDTALNTALDACDKLRDTSNAHQRCSIIEVMGRYCGDIALAVGVAAGAEVVIHSKETFNLEEILAEAKTWKAQNKRHALVVVAEHVTDVHELAREIEEKSGFSCRATILGHIQRGGSPTAQDRILASRMGHAAVLAALGGRGGIAIAIKNNEIIEIPLAEALTAKKNMFKNFDELMHILS